MNRLASSLLAVSLATGILAAPAMAASVKIGYLTPMSGPMAGIGAMYKPTIDYVVGGYNAAGGWHGNKVEVTIYDDSGTTQGAADRLKQALSEGVRIIVAGGTSPLGSQNLADIRRWNERNPDDPAMLLIVGAEGTNFIGSDCYFYLFHFTTTPFVRQNALALAMKDAGVLGTRVASLQPDYTMGQQMEQSTVEGAKRYGYDVVATIRHDVFKIHDFSPFIEKLRAAGAETVFTASSESDLLLILQAASSSGLKSKFGAMFLDQPGNIASAGKAALGSFDAQIFNAEAGGAAGEAYRADYAKIAGADPVAFANNGVITLKLLTAALSAVPAADRLSISAVASALETVKVDWPIGTLSMRADDHQVQLPLVISEVSEAAQDKADGTAYGFKPVKVLSAAETATAVDPACKMVRPAR